mmetsp:Transcript_25317/g.56231  ORF Transcript_25317/g.56231 Transcript_25317/m.56231 type:complete len:2153 (+) Transcript_25317:556-7014(+)
MELGAHVWLRSDASQWGWVPAVITRKEESTLNGIDVINLTLENDPYFEGGGPSRSSSRDDLPSYGYLGGGSSPLHNGGGGGGLYDDYYNPSQENFEVVVTVDPEQLKTADHDDIKLRNLPASYQIAGEDPEAGVLTSPSTHVDDRIVGGVDDLIGLTHLHEPAILHALRLRYDANIIYTSTGPILIAVNPFKAMPLYSDDMMERYRIHGEGNGGGGGSGSGSGGGGGSSVIKSTTYTPFKQRGGNKALTKNGADGKDVKRLPPHPYQTADDAYRAMMRGIENQRLMGGRGGRGGSSPRRPVRHGDSGIMASGDAPTDQSILVSGESGAGKTVTTKIVLNYFAMLSKKITDAEVAAAASSYRNLPSPTASGSGKDLAAAAAQDGRDVSIEQQVLQSNPILESFGNARTIRNDNSSRFGKYIDIRFTPNGKLSGASIETYLLEKVRLIHPSAGERNYHVFYQFLSSATPQERDAFFCRGYQFEDFRLLCQTGTYDRRDGVRDEDNHNEMLDAMVTIGFEPELIQSLMRLVVGVLHAGNMTFTPHTAHDHRDESCVLDENDPSLATAALLGVTFEELSNALTTRVVNAGVESIHKTLSIEQAVKATEALIKSVYGAAFDYIVELVNDSIDNLHGNQPESGASIGVLDIFGFETFQVNNFEQLCINYTNEALQQQFNKFVFKVEQKEYEKEGILWKFIAFPDNQDVLDLIDLKHTGVLALLDEQCIVPKSTDEKFTRYLYSRCDKHDRFAASSKQRVDYKFSIEHYAGPVEYTTDGWLEKNKDQLPAAAAELLKSSEFGLIHNICKYVRSEERGGRGTVATKSVGAQFAAQLKTLRARIDTTVPHYIRCLKPNDDLVPDHFEPKNIVEQLRCGGVLEAVRVSRAGYPTRYPHDVFLARYYILGDQRDTTPASPLKGRNFSSGKEAELKKLIDKIAYDVWDADHQMMMKILEVERAKQEKNAPKYGRGGKGGGQSQLEKSIAWESSVMTPEEKRRKEKDRLSSLPAALREKHHTIARPESKEEFFALDFGARCAVAGLQLGRTKVFLRREAFDRIESLRSGVFFGAAQLIQANIRRKLCRDHYLDLRASTIKIQSQSRVVLARNKVHWMKVSNAVVKIQSFVRMVSAKWTVYRCYQEMRNSACTIQRAYRMHLLRKMGTKTQQIAVEGVTRLQAAARGRKSRASTAGMAAAAAAAVGVGAASAARAVPPAPPADAEPQRKPVASREIIEASKAELLRYVEEENWSMVETMLDQNPDLAEEVDENTGELPLHIIARHSNAWTLLVDMILVLYPKALIHKDRMGAMPIHHASAHDNLPALEIIHAAYKEGVNEVDYKGRLPIHVAAEFDAVDAVKFLLNKSPEGAFTMVHRPQNNSGGGLPLHIACRNYASIGVITALLAENFASAKRADENGDLPLHLLLRCGEVVDQVVVKTLLTCFSGAVSRTDMYGDLPLAIAIKHECKPAVINTVLMQYPEASSILNGEGQSPLFLSFQHNADDRTILGLLNHAPETATTVDKKTGLLPIQIATENEHSHFIVHNLLKRDMPIDLKEKVRAQLLPHHYSWNHIVTNTDDMYFQVVTKVLQQCTQPQVLALAHVEGADGKIALASATPVCKHELRVMLRLFNTLEVVNQRPAYTNPVSDTQIFYALRYEPPANSSGAFTVLHEEPKDGVNDYVEDWDDTSVVSSMSRSSIRSSLSSRTQQTVEERLRRIKKEKGQQVIAKLTSRSDVVERELKVRKEHHLSRHYVPAIISVHHTVQHAAYSEAMAEPGYCITMEGADTTAENLMLDLRKSSRPFPPKALKRIGISLLHMHEHGLIHGDFGTHNIGKFGSRWKLLGAGGSVAIGEATDPNRGFYHPPESIVVETKRTSMGKKAISACVVSIPAQASYDIWAYGVVIYEAITGTPLSAYACRGKRAMSSTEVAKIGRWDERSLAKALRAVEHDDNATDLLHRLLQHDPAMRCQSIRDILEHPFFSSPPMIKAAGEEPIRQSMSSSTRQEAPPPALAPEPAPMPIEPMMSKSPEADFFADSNNPFKPAPAPVPVPPTEVRQSRSKAQVADPFVIHPTTSEGNTAKTTPSVSSPDNRENVVNGSSPTFPSKSATKSVSIKPVEEPVTARGKSRRKSKSPKNADDDERSVSTFKSFRKGLKKVRKKKSAI